MNIIRRAFRKTDDEYKASNQYFAFLDEEIMPGLWLEIEKAVNSRSHCNHIVYGPKTWPGHGERTCSRLPGHIGPHYDGICSYRLSDGTYSGQEIAVFGEEDELTPEMAKSIQDYFEKNP